MRSQTDFLIIYVYIYYFYIINALKYSFKIEYLTIIYSILINLHLHVVIYDDYY